MQRLVKTTYNNGILAPVLMPQFAFNGKEKDNETYGEGNECDFGARIYNPRLGRWLSLDPFQEKYADLTPYNFVANNPIVFIDPSGKTIIVGTQDQSKFIQDMTKIYGTAAATMFSFNSTNNELMVSGATALTKDQQTVYDAIVTVVNQKDVTRIIYTNGPAIDPTTKQQETDQNGSKLDVRETGGELTKTITDNPGTSENKIYVLNSPEAGGTTGVPKVETKMEDGRKIVKGISTEFHKVEPRVTDIIHGMGHVLNPKQNDQYKVIDLDDAGRRAAQLQERPYDAKHSSPDGTHDSGKFPQP